MKLLVSKCQGKPPPARARPRLCPLRPRRLAGADRHHPRDGRGGGRFFDYTAYGDTINTAARLEAANKHLGTRICVSAAAADSLAFDLKQGGRIDLSSLQMLGGAIINSGYTQFNLDGATTTVGPLQKANRLIVSLAKGIELGSRMRIMCI